MVLLRYMTNRMTIRELTLNDTNRMTIRELTLNDGQQDDDDEEKEGDVKEDAVHLVGIPIWGVNLVTWKQNTWLLTSKKNETRNVYPFIAKNVNEKCRTINQKHLRKWLMSICSLHGQ